MLHPSCTTPQHVRQQFVGVSTSYFSLAPTDEAFTVDIVRCVVSLPSAVSSVKRILLPYLSVGAIFAVFVVWNGGIVLGEFLSRQIFRVVFNNTTYSNR